MTKIEQRGIILRYGKLLYGTTFALAETITVESVEFSDWNTMKEFYKGTVTRFVKENKPIGSPVPSGWFDKGGALKIDFLEDGSQIWNYTNAAGNTVPYSPQLINGEWVKTVDFSAYLHPDSSIASIDIGEFTNREDDYAAVLEYLKLMGYDEVPAGYVVHHSTENGIIQLVEQAIHSEFSHYGGVYFYE